MGSRAEKSLGALTKRLVEAVNENGGTLNLREFCKDLSPSNNRRIYDVVNVLEGVGYLTRIEKHVIQRRGDIAMRSLEGGPNAYASLSQMRNEVEAIDGEMRLFFELHKILQGEMDNFAIQNQVRTFSFVNQDNIIGLDIFKGKTKLTIQAPTGAILTVPRPILLHNGKLSYDLVLHSDLDPIDVSLIVDEEEIVLKPPTSQASNDGTEGDGDGKDSDKKRNDKSDSKDDDNEEEEEGNGNDSDDGNKETGQHSGGELTRKKAKTMPSNIHVHSIPKGSPRIAYRTMAMPTSMSPSRPVFSVSNSTTPSTSAATAAAALKTNTTPKPRALPYHGDTSSSTEDSEIARELVEMSSMRTSLHRATSMKEALMAALRQSSPIHVTVTPQNNDKRANDIHSKEDKKEEEDEEETEDDEEDADADEEDKNKNENKDEDGCTWKDGAKACKHDKCSIKKDYATASKSSQTDKPTDGNGEYNSMMEYVDEGDSGKGEEDANDKHVNDHDQQRKQVTNKKGLIVGGDLGIELDKKKPSIKCVPPHRARQSSLLLNSQSSVESDG
eukprot:m.99719 g.99719  ORF g.99719 m.99719 type:complete len:556 (-) comp12540_c0_seq1:219-1886(-)